MEILYQVDARIYHTAKMAAQEFARSYWPEPRNIRFDADTHTFRMIGGNRTYKVTLVNGRLIGGCDATMLFTITVKD